MGMWLDKDMSNNDITEAAEILHHIRAIEAAAFGMGVPVNAGQAAIIAKLRSRLPQGEG